LHVGTGRLTFGRAKHEMKKAAETACGIAAGFAHQYAFFVNINLD
jgi:hypothetical protein